MEEVFRGIEERARIELRLEDQPGSTIDVRSAIDSLANRFGLNSEERFDLKLAATEALTNAVKEAGDGHVVEVVLEGHDDVVDVQVVDRGRFVPPSPRSGFSEGGRGIPIMLALADQIEFTQTGDGTRVRIRKRISRGPS
jgi:serine/threonine-protein kinase RsbW